MGVWAAGSFESDSALDWLGQFTRVIIFSLVRTALIGDFATAEFHVARKAVAAADLVACSRGFPPPEPKADWLIGHESIPLSLLQTCWNLPGVRSQRSRADRNSEIHGDRDGMFVWSGCAISDWSVDYRVEKRLNIDITASWVIDCIGHALSFDSRPSNARRSGRRLRVFDTLNSGWREIHFTTCLQKEPNRPQ